jgi:hypothetical protein
VVAFQGIPGSVVKPRACAENVKFAVDRAPDAAVRAIVPPIPFPVDRPVAIVCDLKIKVGFGIVVEKPIASSFWKHISQGHSDGFFDCITLLSHGDSVGKNEDFLISIEVMALQDMSKHIAQHLWVELSGCWSAGPVLRFSMISESIRTP